MQQLTTIEVQNEPNWGLILTLIFIVLIVTAFIYLVSYLIFDYLDGQIGKEPVDADQPVIYDPTMDSWN